MTDEYVPNGEATRIFIAQDRVLNGLASVTPYVNREALYSLPPWRAAMLARIACAAGAMPRSERDAIVNEARLFGGAKALKPWADRTPRERERGVRAGR